LRVLLVAWNLSQSDHKAFDKHILNFFGEKAFVRLSKGDNENYLLRLD
jgi:hypothetical protein